MKRKTILLFCLLSIFFISSCDNNEINVDNNGTNNDNNETIDGNNNSNSGEEIINDTHHVHLVDESKTIHHDENCLLSEFDEYLCECGKTVGVSKADKPHNKHDFVNGVCKKCGYEESPYEISVLTPTTCAIYLSSIEENSDLVIPDKIYGLDVVEVSCNSFIVPKKINSITIGKNIKKIGFRLNYQEYDPETFAFGDMKYVEIGEFNYTSTIYDFVNIDFAGCLLGGAKKVTINGKDIKNLVLPDDIDLSNSHNTFGGGYIESITLPDNLSTMGKNTFDIDTLNDSVFNTDSNGIRYLKSKSNNKYMLAKFGDNSGNLTIDSSVKMIYGPAWINCNYNKVTINDNVKYFTDIGGVNEIKNFEDTGYDIFRGEIKYTGSLENWFKKEFLRYRKVKFSDYYMSEPRYFGDICDYHNPVALALKFTCGNIVLKDSSTEYYYTPKDITLNIPEGVKKTNNFALEDCKFTNIYIPKSLKEIGTKSIGVLTRKPLQNTENYNKIFPSVYYAGNINDWLNIDFDSYLANPFVNDSEYFMKNKLYINSNELLCNLVIPEGVEEIKVAQFAGINSIVSITFPSTLKYIDDFAFSRCDNIYREFGSYGLSGTVSDLLDCKNNNDEFDYCCHYLEEANLDLEKLDAELKNKKFDIIIPKNVNYIGMCSFETYEGGIHIYIPKEVEYVSTYAMCTGRIGDYTGPIYLNYLYTDRDNVNDLKWNFMQETNYGKKLAQICVVNSGYSFGDPIYCNISTDDIVVNDYVYYKKTDNNTLIPLTAYSLDSKKYYVYSNDNIEPIVLDSFEDNVNIFKGIEIGNKTYDLKLDNNYVLSLYSIGLNPHSIYISNDVKSIDFTDDVLYWLYDTNYYYEGTEEEWNNICKNENIIPKAYNCTLVPLL